MSSAFRLSLANKLKLELKTDRLFDRLRRNYMPPAARILDPIGHPGMITGPGVPNVLIGGLPAAVMGDMVACTMPPLAGPHPPSPIVLGSVTVLIGGRPAARMGDMSGCGAPIVMGMPTVLIGG